MPELSVIICTRNRLHYLRKALKSVMDQSVSGISFEIVVVDNGSTDKTSQYVKELAEQCSLLKYTFEAKLGLSTARNTGCMVSTGKYLAFLDDDAIASRKWLEKIYSAFNSGESGIGCVGGKIDLIWEKPRPLWLHDGLLSQLGKLDISDQRILLFPNQYLFGGNFAISKDALETCGLFDPRLGRQGKKLISNEEIELQKRLASSGISRVYDPEILIYHHARTECISRKWFLRRRYWQGVSESIEKMRLTQGALEHLMAYTSNIMNLIIKVLFLIIKGPSINSLLELSYSCGRLLGLHQGKGLF